MRILVAHNHYRYAGGEDAVAANEIAMLRSRGHEVLSMQADNNTIHGPADTVRAAGSLFGSKASYESMTRFLARFPADVVHVHNWFPLLSPSIITAAVSAGVPVVHTLHNFRMLCANGLLYRQGAVCRECIGKTLPLAGTIHACYRNSRVGSALIAGAFAYHRAAGTWQGISRFIALSEFQREILISGGLSGDLISVKPNFVPDVGLVGKGDGGYFLFVGRLTPEKGIRTALRAWEEHDLGMPLHVIGDGPLRDEVASRAARCGRIEYLGPQAPSRVAAAMAASKALVFPSEWFEPFALAVIEALSRGTPVLASDVESIRGFVKQNGTGLIFSAGSAKDLAQAASSLCDDEAGYQELRARCRAEYLTQYTEATNYPRLLRIYEEAIERNSRTSATQKPLGYLGQPIAEVTALPVANIIGAPVHVIDIGGAVEAIHSALTCGRKGYICLAGAHGIVAARRDPALRAIAAGALLVLADGMPTVWLGRAQGFRGMKRVFGPDLMLKVLRESRFEHTRHFFWGGSPGLAEELRTKMEHRFPNVKIVGTACPPFSDLAQQDIANLSAEVALLKPDIIWVGISTPKQDRLMAQLLPLLDTTLMIGVGAAFLFHTGAIQDSPEWVKQMGLQWLHRLIQEPSRLWRRYLACVPLFAFHALLQYSGLRRYPLSNNLPAGQCTTGVQPFVRQP